MSFIANIDLKHWVQIKLRGAAFATSRRELKQPWHLGNWIKVGLNNE